MPAANCLSPTTIWYVYLYKPVRPSCSPYNNPLLNNSASAAYDLRCNRVSCGLRDIMLKNLPLILLVAIVAWAQLAIRPPPPKLCGSPGGPPITAPRIRLKDGRHMAYKESGVPKEKARYKIIFVHGFDGFREAVVIATHLPKEVAEDLGVYIVSFDRPGYGESDPNPKRAPRNMASDIEELADQLGLGDKFYLAGYSMGGHTVWSCLKYIPHRLAGAALIAPAVNVYWSGFPSKMVSQVFKNGQFGDKMMLWIGHYTPWLTYWWNTQRWFSSSSVAAGKPRINSRDLQLFPQILPTIQNPQVRQQGEYESIHRDINVGSAKWEFSPMDLLPNPCADNINNESTCRVHLWQGDEDGLIPIFMQRNIAKSLPWIHYHELQGEGHLFPYAQGMAETIVRTLLSDE